MCHPAERSEVPGEHSEFPGSLLFILANGYSGGNTQKFRERFLKDDNINIVMSNLNSQLRGYNKRASGQHSS
jgi:hypothetical protein